MFLVIRYNKNHALLRELPAISETLDHSGFSTILIATRLATGKQPTFFLPSHLQACSSCSTSNP
jgi:hypothetical protein